MVDKGVGHYQAADLEATIEQPVGGKELQDMATKAADRTFLDHHQHFVVARQLADEVVVERFHEAGIGDRGR